MGLLTLLARLRQLCCSSALLPEAVLGELRAGRDAITPAQVNDTCDVS